MYRECRLRRQLMRIHSTLTRNPNHRGGCIHAMHMDATRFEVERIFFDRFTTSSGAGTPGH